MKKYQDALQSKLEAWTLWLTPTKSKRDLPEELLTGHLMFVEGVFYDEAKRRIKQAAKTIKTAK